MSVRTHVARPFIGLALVFLSTFVLLALVARAESPASAFASSPSSPLLSPLSRPGPAAAAALAWPRALGMGLVSLGALLVVGGLAWLTRRR